MKDFPDFFEWCNKRKLNPYLEEEPSELVDDEAPKGNIKAESSATKRAAIRSHAYPPLYGRSQYPPEYFRPIASDAPVYQSLDPDIKEK